MVTLTVVSALCDGEPYVEITTINHLTQCSHTINIIIIENRSWKINIKAALLQGIYQQPVIPLSSAITVSMKSLPTSVTRSGLNTVILPVSGPIANLPSSELRSLMP